MLLRVKNKLALWLSVLAMAAAISSPVFGQVASNTNTGATYADIPSAVNAAGSGHTVVIFAGTHNTNIFITLKTNLSLIGWPWLQSADNTSAILDGNGFTSVSNYGITISNSAGIRVEGLSVRLFTNGIYVGTNSSNITIVHNNIYSNGPVSSNTHNGGIYLYGGNIVSNFVLTNRIWRTLGMGICIWGADNSLFEGNFTYWNSSGGIGNPNWSHNSDSNIFRNNLVCSNFATGFRGWGGSRCNLFISNAVISNNGKGFDTPSMLYNTYVSNYVSSNVDHGFGASWSAYSNMYMYNDVVYNNYGFYIDGQYGSDRSNYIVSNRIILNRSEAVNIAYADYNWVIGNQIISNANRGVIIQSSTNGTTVSNVVINNIIFANTNEGVYLVHDAVTACIIASNFISDNSYGIRIGDSDTNLVVGNIVCSNRSEGIYLYPGNPASTNWTITNCIMNTVVSNYVFAHTAAAMGRGILVNDDRADSNFIASNIVYGNRIGLQVTEAEYQTIVFNSITNNTSYNLYSSGTFDGNRGVGLVAYNNIFGAAGINVGVSGGWVSTNLQTNYFGTMQSSAIATGISGNPSGFGFYAPYRLGPIGIFQADTTSFAPPVITNAATNASSEIVIQWQAVGGVAGYRVYKEIGAGSYNVTAPYTNVGPAVTTITDAAVAPDTPYSYYVTAYDAATPLENESFFSTPSTVTIFTKIAASNTNTGVTYYTVNAAVTNAGNDETVVMFAGTNLAENIMITGKTNFKIIGWPWLTNSSTAAIVDGTGLSGPYNYGITVSNSMNISIIGLTVRNFLSGIYLWAEVSNCLIANNNVYSNGGVANYACGGIHLYSNNVVSNAVLSNQVWGNRVGIIVSNVSSNAFIGNFCHRNQTYGIGSPSYQGQSRIQNRYEYNTVCSNGGNGMSLSSYYISNTVISNTVFSNNGTGIFCDGLRFSTVVSNDVYRNTSYGIYISGGAWMDNTLYGYNRIFENTSYGFYLNSENCDSNNIVWNDIWSNLNGIRVQNGDHSIFASNWVASNVNHGICFMSDTNIGTRSNRVFNNTVFDNSQQGIYLYSGGVMDTFVTSNTVFRNLNSGICIYQADTNRVYGNIVFSNAQGGGLY